VEECLKLGVYPLSLTKWTDSQSTRYATQREVFGRPLISQPVVRSKLAAMFSRVESSQAWLENVTFQMTCMNHRQAEKLAGSVASQIHYQFLGSPFNRLSETLQFLRCPPPVQLRIRQGTLYRFAIYI
jgi:alkylation response protein AidB-like acyl-CoA dehydrogenase